MRDKPIGDSFLQNAPGSGTDDADYHVTRARVELDQAYRAEPRAAAEAHMRLYSLHMERARSVLARASITNEEQ